MKKRYFTPHQFLRKSPFYKVKPTKRLLSTSLSRQPQLPYLPSQLLGSSTSAPAPLSLSSSTKHQPENNL